jgi:electron transfer flavoprotein beta subunit
MNIVVCIKEITDPEATIESYKIDSTTKALVPIGKILKVVNPFDEQAVEAALRIKDKALPGSGQRLPDGALPGSPGGMKDGKVKVSVVSLGNNLDRVVVKKPLNMGADELFLLEDETYVGGDSWSNAQALAAAIKKIGEVDLILCGRQAADSNAGQTGIAIAHFLGLPCVTVARKIEIADGRAIVERVIANGYETVEVTLPAVITVSNELGQARYPAIKNIARSAAIKPVIWKPSDLGIEPTLVGAQGRQLITQDCFIPVFEATCEIVTGDTVEEAAQALAVRLREERIL